MFKILVLSKITIILTTSVNNTDNVYINDLVYYFFKKNDNIYGRKSSVGHDTSYFHSKYVTFNNSFCANQRSFIPNNIILPSDLMLLIEHTLAK